MSATLFHISLGRTPARRSVMEERMGFDLSNEMRAKRDYDRSAEDIGNIIHLEHVNVYIADQAIGTLFYVTGLGLTRDPFLMTSTDNMWVNVGRSQFHLI